MRHIATTATSSDAIANVAIANVTLPGKGGSGCCSADAVNDLNAMSHSQHSLSLGGGTRSRPPNVRYSDSQAMISSCDSSPISDRSMMQRAESEDNFSYSQVSLIKET